MELTDQELAEKFNIKESELDKPVTKREFLTTILNIEKIVSKTLIQAVNDFNLITD